jgi:hypothetical protein
MAKCTIARTPERPHTAALVRRCERPRAIDMFTSDTVFFFDSWGGLWVTCSVDHPDAVAFGPSGVSRKANPAEAGLNPGRRYTAHGAAARAGRIGKYDPQGSASEWDVLA